MLMAWDVHVRQRTGEMRPPWRIMRRNGLADR